MFLSYIAEAKSVLVKAVHDGYLPDGINASLQQGCVTAVPRHYEAEIETVYKRARPLVTS